LADLGDQDGQDAGCWGVHLRMTGQFLWIAAPARSSAAAATEREAGTEKEADRQVHVRESEPGPHTRVRFWSSSGDELRFIDTRSFAQMWWVPPNRPIEQVITGLARLGPEPFDPAFSAAHLQQRLRGSSRAIKTALLDQSLVAGVGNIYADESLFAAGINPTPPPVASAAQLWIAYAPPWWRSCRPASVLAAPPSAISAISRGPMATTEGRPASTGARANPAAAVVPRS
jgi:formamidopyrimidine-DNA glycosylase